MQVSFEPEILIKNHSTPVLSTPNGAKITLKFLFLNLYITDIYIAPYLKIVGCFKNWVKNEFLVSLKTLFYIYKSFVKIDYYPQIQIRLFSILHSINYVRSYSPNSKYQKFSSSGFQDLGIRTFEFLVFYIS